MLTPIQGMTLLIIYLVVSCGFGAFLDLIHPSRTWKSVLVSAALGPIILPQVILSCLGLQI